MTNFISKKGISLLAIMAGIAIQPTTSFAQVAITGVKWYPGHYILNDSMSTSAREEILTSFENIPKMVGIQSSYQWSTLEVRQLDGTYKYDFSKIDADIQQAKNHGKKLSLSISYKYSNSLPQYVKNYPGQSVLLKNSTVSVWVPPYYVQSGGGEFNVGDHANFGHPKTLAAFAKLLQALANKYDKNPNVAFIQFKETSVGRDISDNQDINFIDGIIDMNTKAGEYFNHTPVIQSINFPRKRLKALINNLTTQKMGFGGPDTFWGSFDLPDNALAFNTSGSPKSGVYWYNIANYTVSGVAGNNNLPISMQIHDGGFKYSTRENEIHRKIVGYDTDDKPITVSDPIPHNLPLNQSVQKLYNFGVNKLGSNFLVWQIFGPADPNRIALKTALTNNAMNTKTACPKIFNNTCQ